MADKAPERIAIPDLRRKWNIEGSIVDAHTKEIQESGAVPNAVHVPMDQIEQCVAIFPKPTRSRLCGEAAGSRAAQVLWDAGHRNVFYRFRDWKRKNAYGYDGKAAVAGKSAIAGWTAASI
jgi:hypothetical protein